MSDNDAERKEIFLSFFKETRCNISGAARKMGINRRQIYRWKNEDAEFQRDLEYAFADFQDQILAELVDTCLSRDSKPSMPRMVGLIFLAKSICGLVEGHQVTHFHAPFDQEQITAMERAHKLCTTQPVSALPNKEELKHF